MQGGWVKALIGTFVSIGSSLSLRHPKTPPVTVVCSEKRHEHESIFLLRRAPARHSWAGPRQFQEFFFDLESSNLCDVAFKFAILFPVYVRAEPRLWLDDESGWNEKRYLAHFIVFLSHSKLWVWRGEEKCHWDSCDSICIHTYPNIRLQRRLSGEPSKLA